MAYSSRSSPTLVETDAYQHFTFRIELAILIAVECDRDSRPLDYLLDLQHSHIRLGTGNGLKDDASIFGRRTIDNKGIAQIANILRDRGLQAGTSPRLDFENVYDHWNVTLEPTVMKAWKRYAPRLSEWTHGAVECDPDSGTRWLYDGSQLVSKVLELPMPDTELPHTDFCEVKKYVNALQPKPNEHFVILSQPTIGGLHVHIGLRQLESHSSQPPSFDIFQEAPQKSIPTQRQIPLKILQHLAFILIEYEDVISELHDPERRGILGTKTEHIAESNRVGIQLQRHVCGKPNLPSLQEVWRNVFRHDMTQARLADLMDQHTTVFEDQPSGPPTSRNKFVSFEQLKENDKTPTIKFRQHGGTLDADHVERWLQFLTKLMRAAEKKAMQETPPTSPAGPVHKPWRYYPDESRPKSHHARQGMKYSVEFPPIREGTKAARRDRFFALLEMTCDEMIYWSKIAIGFDLNAYAYNESEEHICDQCLEEQIQRDETWEPPSPVSSPDHQDVPPLSL